MRVRDDADVPSVGALHHPREEGAVVTRQRALDHGVDVALANTIAPDEELEHAVRRRAQKVG